MKIYNLDNIYDSYIFIFNSTIWMSLYTMIMDITTLAIHGINLPQNKNFMAIHVIHKAIVHKLTSISLIDMYGWHKNVNHTHIWSIMNEISVWSSSSITLHIMLSVHLNHQSLLQPTGFAIVAMYFITVDCTVKRLKTVFTVS